jgi:hypothetical protein
MIKMDNFANPGVILGTIDLAGILATWVYLQKEVQKLNKQILKCREECSLKSDCKETGENVQRIMEEFEKKLNNIIAAVNANRAMINNLNDRLMIVEKNSSLVVTKGDSTPIKTIALTSTAPVSSPQENLPVSASVSTSASKSSKDESRTKNDDSSDEDDEVDLVVKLAKSRKVD